MFLFFIYVYIFMQNRRQGTSIKGAFESLGGGTNHVWGGGGGWRCRCVLVLGGEGG